MYFSLYCFLSLKSLLLRQLCIDASLCLLSVFDCFCYLSFTFPRPLLFSGSDCFQEPYGVMLPGLSACVFVHVLVFFSVFVFCCPSSPSQSVSFAEFIDSSAAASLSLPNVLNKCHILSFALIIIVTVGIKDSGIYSVCVL